MNSCACEDSTKMSELKNLSRKSVVYKITYSSIVAMVVPILLLENETPKRAPFDQKMRKKEEEKHNRKGKKSSQNKKKNHTDKRNRRRRKEQKPQNEEKGQRHFVIRKKD